MHIGVRQWQDGILGGCGHMLQVMARTCMGIYAWSILNATFGHPRTSAAVISQSITYVCPARSRPAPSYLGLALRHQIRSY